MPELLAALEAFLQERCRCGELDGGVEGKWVWMACECGVEVPRLGGTLAGPCSTR